MFYVFLFARGGALSKFSASKWTRYDVGGIFRFRLVELGSRLKGRPFHPNGR
jgi:hypothetical protein